MPAGGKRSNSSWCLGKPLGKHSCQRGGELQWEVKG
jgi:hypothetical protein